MINLFVDDIREIKDVYPDMNQLPLGIEDNWVIARTSWAAKEILNSCVQIEIISLDHDLGGDDTIEPVLSRLQEMAYTGIRCPNYIMAHSSNPVGVEKIRAVAEFVKRYR